MLASRLGMNRDTTSMRLTALAVVLLVQMSTPAVGEEGAGEVEEPGEQSLRVSARTASGVPLNLAMRRALPQGIVVPLVAVITDEAPPDSIPPYLLVLQR